MLNDFNIQPEDSQGIDDPYLQAINNITDGSEDLEKIKNAFWIIEQRNNNELHNIRKTHLRHLFYLTCVWSGIVIFILISQGLQRLWWLPTCYFSALKFNLESSVLIAFITSTTATIIGLYTIAAYWLFNKKD